MDRLERHRKIVQEILTQYHQINEKSGSTTESALAFDEVHDQYLLLLMGWQKDERIKSVMIHIRLKNKLIWIEEDWTEEGIANELLKEGIPKSDIVLAFYPQEERKFTEFAIT
jgi:hypothetical protein